MTYTLAKDIPYKTVGSSTLGMNRWKPSTTPKALNLGIHGGGWHLGDNDGADQIARAFPSSLTYSPDYRLAPDTKHPLGSPGRAQWQAQYEDIRDGLTWALANAYYLYPHLSLPVVLFGTSAGAHLAAIMLCLSQPRAAACFGWSGPYDLTGSFPAKDATLLRNFLGPADPASASPVDHLYPGFPPTLLCHSQDDGIVPVAQSIEMRDRMVAMGLTVKLDIFSGTAHGSGLFSVAMQPTLLWLADKGL